MKRALPLLLFGLIALAQDNHAPSKALSSIASPVPELTARKSP